VVAFSKAGIGLLDTGIMGLNPAQGMDVCPRIRAGPNHVGAPGKLIIWHLFKSIFLKIVQYSFSGDREKPILS
jgi:hypothetical protein